MKLANVQSTAKSLIEADASLSAYAPALLLDGVTDLSATIDQALQDKGACVAVSDLYGGNANPGSASSARGIVHAFVYDNPHVAHTPSAGDLTDAVIVALTRRNAFQLSGWEKLQNEKGGTLTICEFHALIVFNE